MKRTALKPPSRIRRTPMSAQKRQTAERLALKFAADLSIHPKLLQWYIAEAWHRGYGAGERAAKRKAAR